MTKEGGEVFRQTLTVTSARGCYVGLTTDRLKFHADGSGSALKGSFWIKPEVAHEVVRLDNDLLHDLEIEIIVRAKRRRSKR
jgi:hypothetical protein